MIPSDTIQIAKLVAIESYLAHRGFHPVRQSGQRLTYLSPLRLESTPSFFVNQSINRYNDFGSSEKGDDVIRLVMLLNSCSFDTAVKELQRFAGQPDKATFFLSGHFSLSAAGTDKIKAVKLLESKALVRYVESRRISYPIARKYVREVYYTQSGYDVSAVGFENDKGGFALRKEWTDKAGNVRQTKRNIGPSWFTIIEARAASTVNVFEGMFDFLSALEYYRQQSPTFPTLVLNSTTNLENAFPLLKNYERVNAYMDNDTAGRTTLKQLSDTGIKVEDHSKLFAKHKDFNEFWLESALNRIIP